MSRLSSKSADGFDGARTAGETPADFVAGLRFSAASTEVDDALAVYGKRLDEAADKIELLATALTALSDLYTFAWDRVDGGLMMMERGVERFEEAHRLARIALGTPLVGDNGELDEEEQAPASRGEAS